MVNQDGIALKKRYPKLIFLVMPKLYIVNHKKDYNTMFVSMFEIVYKQSGKQSYTLIYNNGAESG